MALVRGNHEAGVETMFIACELDSEKEGLSFRLSRVNIRGCTKGILSILFIVNFFFCACTQERWPSLHSLLALT